MKVIGSDKPLNQEVVGRKVLVSFNAKEVSKIDEDDSVSTHWEYEQLEFPLGTPQHHIDLEVASRVRAEAMLQGADYNGYQVSFTAEDGNGLLQVEGGFNKLKQAIELGLLPPETEIKTIIHFENGTKLPMTAEEFPEFALWFVNERNKFFLGAK